MAARGPTGVAVRVLDPDVPSTAAMEAADVALAKSGSVNVELALLDVPHVVVYRLSRATAFVARRVLGMRVEHIGLVNLILGRAAVPEFVQEAAEPEAVAAAALELLLSPAAAAAQRREFAALRRAMGPAGAVDRAAARVLAAMDRAGIERLRAVAEAAAAGEVLPAPPSA